MDKYCTALSNVMNNFLKTKGATEEEYKVFVGRNSLGRSWAIIIWGGFDGMEVTKRQEEIWDFINKDTGKDYNMRFVTIYAFGFQEENQAEELVRQEEGYLRYG